MSAGKAYQVDVTDEAAVKKAVNEQVREFDGRLDIFVANSGIPWTQGAATAGEVSHYHKVVSTDLDGVFFCGRAAAEVWRRQAIEGTDLDGRKLENYTLGSFIATASMSGHIVNVPQLQAAYNAAKAGVIHLCKHWTLSLSILEEICMLMIDRNSSPLSRRRVDTIRALQHRLTGLYCHGNIRLCASRNKRSMEK